MAHIEIKNLSFTYPDCLKPALKNINLNIAQGEYVTFCGYSGSGKTTLLKHLKPVLTPYGEKSGEIKIDGETIDRIASKDLARRIGFVMQDPETQIVTDKVWHELSFGLENLGVPQDEIRTSVAEMASYFGIQDWFYRDTSTLSGGQKQLLNLASVMAMHPEVLILDEPTSQLDPIAALDFLNTIRKINLELGTTVILTEHRLEEVLTSADRAILLEKGAILYDDTPRNVGKMLYESGNELLEAMPAPMRIYYRADYMGEHENCPLTVREGRAWLSSCFQNGIPIPQKRQAAVKSRENDTVIQMENVWFRYEKQTPDILKGVNLSVGQGEFYAIVGGNGTGKSTLLKAICRLCKPYRGKIRINGENLNRYHAGDLYQNLLTMLPQDPQNLFAKQSVREELEEMLGGKLAGKYEREVELRGTKQVPLHERVAKVADLCEIMDLLSRHPYDLSGGEKQRVALAKVLLTNPRILLLDEPTKGMDAVFKKRFANILTKLKENGVTLVMVSHDIEFCAEYADRVGLFFDGEITSEGKPAFFFSRNSFYTTAANRMVRNYMPYAVTVNHVVETLRKATGNGTESKELQ